MDSEGVPTIGVGHNLNVPLSPAAIALILEDDVRTAIHELDRAFPGWRDHSDARQDVLVELQFNLGANRLAGFKKFWEAMRLKHYEAAASELLASKWAAQVKGRADTLADRLARG